MLVLILWFRQQFLPNEPTPMAARKTTAEKTEGGRHHNGWKCSETNERLQRMKWSERMTVTKTKRHYYGCIPRPNAGRTRLWRWGMNSGKKRGCHFLPYFFCAVKCLERWRRLLYNDWLEQQLNGNKENDWRETACLFLPVRAKFGYPCDVYWLVISIQEIDFPSPISKALILFFKFVSSSIISSRMMVNQHKSFVCIVL
jgi:hypothetical protein